MSSKVKIYPSAATQGPTERVQRIKARFLETTPEICVERAKLITESYKETEGQPIATRRAKALEKIWGCQFASKMMN